MNLNYRILVGLITLFMYSNTSFSQVHVFQLWLDYNQDNKINQKFKFKSDYGVRTQFGDWRRLHARTAIIYKPNTTFDFRGGLGLFYTWSKLGNEEFEIRPWQGTLIGWPNWNRFRIQHYVRLEERFGINLQGSENNFVFKFRYKLGFSFPVNNSVITDGTFYIPISIELFADLTGFNEEITNDRLRFELGLGYRLNTNLSFVLLYTLQEIYNNEFTGIDFGEGFSEIDHIVRISVYQKFGFDD